MAARDIYIAIMVASARGRSLTLRPEELDVLALDDSIERRALNSLTAEECAAVIEGGDDAWEKINPRKKRIAANAASIVEEA
jgi:hypothetical protein